MKSTTLTKREFEVAVLVATNLQNSNKNHADTLGISIKTIEKFRMWINKKLNVHSTAELVVYLLRNRIIALSEIRLSHDNTNTSSDNTGPARPRPL